MSKDNAESLQFVRVEPLQEVMAEHLIRELMQDTGKSLPRLRKGTHLLPLRKARVVGKLDLKHQTIKRPVIIRDCEFEDDVDLRYCEFEQVVDFSGCIFHKEFNSGDEVESHTVFKKDLICNTTVDETVCRKTVFKGPARFNGVRIEGAAFFNKALFLNQKLSIDLTTASIEKGLECNTTIFKGPSYFGRLKCNDIGSFRGAVFSGDEDVLFEFASFSGPLNFSTAIFKGPADFTSLKCDGEGTFNAATFEGKADFTFASFGVNLFCNETRFKGPASFNGVKCGGSGFFHDAKFPYHSEEEITEDEWIIDFIASSFGRNLECQGATFERSADLDSLECAGTAFFTDEFHAKQDIYFSYATFGKNLLFQGSHFGGAVDMTAAHISQDLTLTDARFEQGEQSVVLYNASSDQVKLESTTFPFENVLLDLREYTFKGFAGPEENPEEHALRFARAQDPWKFSRDPYLQLEKYYSSIGDEAQAKTVYYEGRRDLRQNVHKYRNKRTTKPTHWKDRFHRWRRIKLTSWGDWCLKWLTGYGVRTERLLIPIFVVFAIGLLMFSSSDALKVAETNPSAASAASSVKPATNGKQATLTLPDKKADLEGESAELIDRIAYNLDLFLPVDLGITGQWEPQRRWLEIYVLLHSLVGWLLIPLFIASLGGIIRRQ
jgi:hypothetical protein